MGEFDEQDREREYEASRIQELKRYRILDTDPEETFDRITRIAQKIVDVPIALVSLIDENRQWFKSNQGLDAPETPRDISFCTHAIQKDQPFIVHDALNDPRFVNNPLVTGNPDIRFYAGIPLKSPMGYNLGTLCVIDRKPRKISLSQIDILRDLARIVVDEMELRSIATHDCLTGLQRRKSFLIRAEQEMERSERYGSNFSVIALDIDHFKRVNDKFGHAIGDLVLQRIADICRNSIRSVDVAARFGGEEFVVLLPETNLPEAIHIAERIRQNVENTIVEDSGKLVQVTTSFGVADMKTSQASDVKSLLNIADDYLYEAKANGRNCTKPIAA